MSQWTHVCGMVRLDGLDHHDAKSRVERAFYGERPWGSEGPVHFSVDYTGDTGPGYASIIVCNLNIWGDLRDKADETVQDVIEWLENSLAKLGMWMRTCCILVQVEFGKSYLIRETEDNTFTVIDMGQEDNE